MARNNMPSIFISATEKKNIDVLKSLIYSEVLKLRQQRYPSLTA
jgi:GTP-binding protein HflX